MALLLPLINFAAEAGLDQKIDNFFRPVADFIGGVVFYSISIADKSVPIVLIVLIGGAIFFTLYFKFANFRLIPMAIRVVRGDYDAIDQHGTDPAAGDPTPGGDVFETIAVESAEGEVTHFQALTAALSATV